MNPGKGRPKPPRCPHGHSEGSAESDPRHRAGRASVPRPHSVIYPRSPDIFPVGGAEKWHLDGRCRVMTGTGVLALLAVPRRPACASVSVRAAMGPGSQERGSKVSAAFLTAA